MPIPVDSRPRTTRSRIWNRDPIEREEVRLLVQRCLDHGDSMYQAAATARINARTVQRWVHAGVVRYEPHPLNGLSGGRR